MKIRVVIDWDSDDRSAVVTLGNDKPAVWLGADLSLNNHLHAEIGKDGNATRGVAAQSILLQRFVANQ